METILSYLDNMFLNLPKTEKIMKVKKDLSLMMEEKYNELLAEGKKKNEAIGIVISEFGDLKELQEELGLGENVTAETFSEEKSGEEKKTVELKKGDSFEKDHIKESEKILKSISREEAENYRETSKRAAKGISCGVMLCICSPVFILLCAMLDEIQQDGIADALYILGGIVPLFLMVGIAVALFIINGTKLEKYEYLKKEEFVIEENFLLELEKVKESEKKDSMTKITVGVVLCIFSVIPILIASCINEYLTIGSVALLLILVAIAVRFFITGGMNLECMKILFQEKEFSAPSKKSNKIIDTIAGVYWPLMVAIYLIWSFVSGGWGYTWIIWPVAGVSFCVIAVIAGVIEKIRENV